MLGHLEASGNYRIVTGTKLPPRSTNSDAASGYQVRSSHARVAIRDSCSASVRAYTSSIDIPKEIRSKLAERLDSTSSTKGHQHPHRRFIAPRPIEGQPISTCVPALDGICSRLVGLSQAIDDDFAQESIPLNSIDL